VVGGGGWGGGVVKVSISNKELEGKKGSDDGGKKFEDQLFVSLQSL